MAEPQPTPEKGISAGNVGGDDIVIAQVGDNSPGNLIGKNIYQYNITNAPAPRPPLWVNVPSLPQHFLGRDELVTELIAQLTQGHSPALTTDGMPGVGKTALATVLAHHPEVLKHFSDGVLWGGLGTNPDVASVQGQWATALGIDLGDEPDITRRQARINAAVGQQKVLIVLDDAWDLAPAKQLRCTGPNVGHVLTTRNKGIAVGFAGARQAVHVPELDEDPAYALLKTLAPDACAASPAEAEALAKRVGGLPLAIELLGGYLAAPERSMFPDLSQAAFEELATPEARLALAGERLGADSDGMQTLEQVIRLSLEDLEKVEPKAVEAFYCLGAFAPKPATFDRTAAEAVLVERAQSRNPLVRWFKAGRTNSAKLTPSWAVAVLAGRNLIETGFADSLMLHQVVADIARSQTPKEAVEHHSTHYMTVVDTDRMNWRQIEGVYDQIRFALEHAVNRSDTLIEWAGALHVYWERRGMFTEQLQWSQLALEAAVTSENVRGQAVMLNNIAGVYWDLGDLTESLSCLEQVLRLDRKSGDNAGEAQTLNNIGVVYDDLGEKRRALQYYEQALPVLCQIGDKQGEAGTLNNMGNVYAALGDQQQALQYYEQALPLLRQVGDKHGEATTLNNIGLAYNTLCDQQQALQYYEQALPLLRQVGDKHGEATTLNNLGLVYDALGEMPRALQYFDQALPILRQVGNKRGEAGTLNNLGHVYAALGDKQRALQYYDQALPLLRQVGDKSGETQTLNNIGQVYATLGDQQQALQYFDQALPLSRQVGHKSGEATTLHNIGGAYASLGDQRQALQYYDRALPLLRQVGNKSGEATTLNNMALLQYQEERYSDAAATLAGVVDVFHELQAPASEAMALLNLAVVIAEGLNCPADAIDLVRRSIDLLRSHNLPQDAGGQTLAEHEAFLSQLITAARDASANAPQG